MAQAPRDRAVDRSRLHHTRCPVDQLLKPTTPKPDKSHVGLEFIHPAGHSPVPGLLDQGDLIQGVRAAHDRPEPGRARSGSGGCWRQRGRKTERERFGLRQGRGMQM